MQNSHFVLEDAIHRRLQFLKPLKTHTETNLFRLLLHRPNGIGSRISKMNELGLLERWIPEWKPMVSFFQHNQYHYYTADEHTFIVLANAESLEHSVVIRYRISFLIEKRHSLSRLPAPRYRQTISHRKARNKRYFHCEAMSLSDYCVMISLKMFLSYSSSFLWSR